MTRIQKNWLMAGGLMGFTAALLIMFVRPWMTYEEKGIFANDTSTYIALEACVVNMASDRTSIEINKDFIWCMEKHLEWKASYK